MKIKIIKPGIATTIQDGGRFGHRDIGVPVSGCMDHFAAHVANLLVGNDAGSPALELTNGNAHLKVDSYSLLAICGDGCRAIANGMELPYWKTLFLPAGTEIRFKPVETGCRTYIAIAGGWSAQLALDSASTYLPVNMGGKDGAALSRGDQLENQEHISVVARTMVMKLGGPGINSFKWGIFPSRMIDYSTRTIRVIAHHENDWFDSETRTRFYTGAFKLSNNSNRMGYQLSGDAIMPGSQKQLLSTAVSMGTIQVTSAGGLILLMADCQTTGGYPRIAQVAAVDLPICAQLKPGDSISFKEISIADAETAWLNLQRDLADIKKNIAQRVVMNTNKSLFG